MTDPIDDNSGPNEGSEPIEAQSPPPGEGASATDDANDRATDKDEPDDEDISSPANKALSLGDAQKRAQEAAKELLDHQFEGVIKAETADDDDWRTVVEVVERSAVPDTQDIIGRYEIMLGPAGEVTGYELLERYRRNDMKEEL
jgi:hypothetical protein